MVVVSGIVRVEDHLVPHLAAQQIIDRHAQRLALDVPQGDVDGRDGGREDALGREEAAPEEHLPDVFGSHRVLADEQRLEMLDGADHRKLATGQPRLADARDALVGVDDDKKEVP